ncbi:MAG: asparagine synthase (glutamine-hydrolyzing) [Acidimicrobiales bacterium]
MCGIVGIVGHGAGQPATARGAFVEQAVDALRHRGPDAHGVAHFPACSLGHTRLRILDLTPQGDQPMTNDAKTVTVLFNGEIYNFAELRADLERSGHRFRSRTDTEVLVHLYEDHGERLVEHLHGMFAFAVWDEPAQRLLLGRDRLGIKPLYYRIDGASIAFASEARTLVRGNDAIDIGSLAAYLRLGWVPGPETIWRGVQELLPGHTLVWEGSAARIHAYWRPPAMTTPPGEAQVEALSAALARAGRSHLVADVPIGLFLSSGVDSAVVASLAGHASGDIHAFTVVGDWADESVGAAGIAARLGLRHDAVPVSGGHVQSRLDRYFAAMDQPTVDGLNTWVIAGAVRDAGMVVALSGLGGDELFGGYSTFRHVPRLARMARTAWWLPDWVAGAPEAALGRVGRTAHSRARRASEVLTSDGWEAAYAAVRGHFGARELQRLWPPGGSFSHRSMIRNRDAEARIRSHAVYGLEVGNYLPFQLLRDTDVMSMAYGLEVRVPLLDDGVVEVALASPGVGGRPSSKHSLVEAADADLVDLVLQPKKTFTLPIGDWMRGPLRDEAFDSLVALGESDLGFDRRELTAVWDGFREGRVGGKAMWGLVVLARWRESARAVAAA